SNTAQRFRQHHGWTPVQNATRLNSALIYRHPAFQPVITHCRNLYAHMTARRITGAFVHLLQVRMTVPDGHGEGPVAIKICNPDYATHMTICQSVMSEAKLAVRFCCNLSRSPICPVRCLTSNTLLRSTILMMKSFR